MALLLHSLSAFRELILDAFALARVRSVVEVGAETGLFTPELARHAATAGGWFACIDPDPAPAVRDLVAGTPGARLVVGRSPGALSDLERADAYLLDGDHNHATVAGELATIDAIALRAGHPALVLVHDVGWPCARRDLYYDPAALPPSAVHAHAWDRGVVPGDRRTVEGGFRGEGRFALALEEGGPANGVLTALEDFLAGRDDLALARVPLVFGLGVVWPRWAPWAAALAARLAPWDQHPILARVEENRVELYVRVLALQDEANALRSRAEALEPLRARAEEAERHAAAAEARATAAEASAAAELARRERIEAELRVAESTLAWQLAVRARALRDRLAPSGTAVRRALDAGAAAARAAVGGGGSLW